MGSELWIVAIVVGIMALVAIILLPSSSSCKGNEKKTTTAYKPVASYKPAASYNASYNPKPAYPNTVAVINPNEKSVKVAQVDTYGMRQVTPEPAHTGQVTPEPAHTGQALASNVQIPQSDLMPKSWSCSTATTVDGNNVPNANSFNEAYAVAMAQRNGITTRSNSQVGIPNSMRPPPQVELPIGRLGTNVPSHKANLIIDQLGSLPVDCCN